MLVIAELLCRALLGKERLSVQSAVFAPLEGIGFGVAPDLSQDRLTTSPLGTRGRPPDPAAKERILVLGDSMTFAIEVADGETFCQRLEDARGQSCQVINAGCPGYGPEEELATLLRLAPSVKPTRVLLMFCVANDLFDAGAAMGHTYRAVAGRLVAEERYEEMGTPMRLLKNTLARLWSLGLVRAARLPVERTPTIAPDDDGPCGMQHSFVRVLLEADDYARAGDKGEARVATGWAKTPGLLARLRERCRALGADLWVGILPLPVAHDRALLARMEAAWKVPPGSIDVDRPNRKIGELCQSLRIPTIDFAPVFRADPDGARIHLPGDSHLSAYGHGVVAGELARRLR